MKERGKAGRKVPINPRGFNCVNVLVQRAIAKVLRKAKSHDRSSRWNNANRDRISKASSSLYFTKRDQRIRETTEYRKNNKEHLMQKQVKREKERRDTDAQYHTAVLLRQRIRGALMRFKDGKSVKKNTTAELTGVSFQDVVRHLGIDNSQVGKQSGNDIDHIFPVTAYDLSDPEQQRMCFNVSNLQIMNNITNKSKSNKLPSLSDAMKVQRWCWPHGVTEDMLS